MCERYDKNSINVSINNLYSLFYSKDRYFIDFTSRNDITPQAGIYIVFDKKDVTNAYSKGRVVRIGESVNIHERIYKHCSNKNLSIFRRMLGTAVLVDAQKRYLSLWNDEETSESDFQSVFQEPVSKDDIKILESAISRIRD